MFICDLTALSKAQTIQRLMMSLVVNDELAGMCKESVVIQLQVLCGLLLRLRHITRLGEAKARPDQNKARRTCVAHSAATFSGNEF